MYTPDVTPTETLDLTSYLAALRMEVAKHGKEKVGFEPSPDMTRIGFVSPDGWWVLSVEEVHRTCEQEVGDQVPKARRVSAAGKYARRPPSRMTFVNWFSDKVQAAIETGERSRDQGGLS